MILDLVRRLLFKLSSISFIVSLNFYIKLFIKTSKNSTQTDYK